MTQLLVAFTSTQSNNCRDFVASLDYPHIFECTAEQYVPPSDYILVTGTYADAKGAGAFHPVITTLLKDRVAVSRLRGVAASGNAVFGSKFGLAGQIISDALDVPLIHRFELKGLAKDTEIVKSFIRRYNEGQQR